MFMKVFLNGKICLTLVIIQKIKSFLMILINKLLVKWKMNIVEWSYYWSIHWIKIKDALNKKKIVGIESSTAKGVNIPTEFNEFKDVLFNKKS